MGEIEHALPRPAVRCPKQGTNLEGRPFHPGVECGGGKQAVERHGQLEALALRVELIDGEGAQPIEGRSLDLADQFREVEIAAVSPKVLEDVREQDVLA